MGEHSGEVDFCLSMLFLLHHFFIFQFLSLLIYFYPCRSIMITTKNFISDYQHHQPLTGISIRFLCNTITAVDVPSFLFAPICPPALELISDISLIISENLIPFPHCTKSICHRQFLFS